MQGAFKVTLRLIKLDNSRESFTTFLTMGLHPIESEGSLSSLGMCTTSLMLLTLSGLLVLRIVALDTRDSC